MLIADGVVRLIANNPGPFTGPGTNTYLITASSSTVVIDPGPEDSVHSAAIIQAAAKPISHILLTHAHRDHSDGVARLIARTGAITVGFGRTRLAGVARADDSPSGGDFADWGFAPDIRLADGETLTLPGLALHAVHTPGHAPDHLCFALSGTPILISGDHVMGWSTTVIAPPEGNMGRYLASLEKVLGRPETHYLPGHGEPLVDAARQVKAYLLHRQMRERAVLDCVRSGHATIQSVTDRIYAGLSPNLANAARLSVAAHAEHLAEKGLLTYAAPLSRETALQAV